MTGDPHGVTGEGPGPEGEDRGAVLARVRARLRQAGATDEAIDRAVADDVVDLLAVDQLLVPTEHRYTPLEVAERTGLDVEVLKKLWRALGFQEPADDERVLTALDVDAAENLQHLVRLGVTEMDKAFQLARVIGSSMARVAEAEVLQGAEVLHAGDDSLLAADAFSNGAAETVPAMGRLLEFVWRRHMQAVARRAVALRASAATSRSGPELAVGFADMVGFTLLSQHLGDRELAAVVRRFEEISYDTVARSGGRVVKTIGDEVMFVTEDAEPAARIGVDLAEAYADDDLLSDVRVGMAIGPVLVRDGDYFGPVVNLASRIVRIANPGSVLISDEMHTRLTEAAGGELTFRALRPRVLKDVGKVQLWSCRKENKESEENGENGESGDGGDGREDTRPATSGRKRGERRRGWERLAVVLRDLEELRSVGERILAAGTRTGPPTDH